MTTIEPALLAILACPEDKGPLFYIETESMLYNPRLKRSYAVIDGIPVMLIEDSVTLSDAESARIEGLISSLGIKATFTP